MTYNGQMEWMADHVFGHEGVREYWLRQFKTVSSKVTPIKVEEVGDQVKIKVHQVVHDMEGKLLADEIVDHFFYLKNDKVASFDIGAKKDS